MKRLLFRSGQTAWIRLVAVLLCGTFSVHGVTAVAATPQLTTTNYTLTVVKAGNGSGTVSMSPSAATYASGTVVTVTATPAAGNGFDSWSGGASGTNKSIKVAITHNTTVTATFMNYTLSVGTAGTGSGTVSVSPKAATYAKGTVVTLTATPKTGSTFAGWSGGAAGSATSVKVTITGNTTVTATFNITGISGSNYAGTWIGQFCCLYTYYDPQTSQWIPSSYGCNVTLTLAAGITGGGESMLWITDAATDDPFWGNGVQAGISWVEFPSPPANVGTGSVTINFANGTGISTIGNVHMSTDGSTVGNTVGENPSWAVMSGDWDNAHGDDSEFTQTTWSLTHSSL